LIRDANIEFGYYEIIPLSSRNDILQGTLYKVDPENVTIFPKEREMETIMNDETIGYDDGSVDEDFYEETNILDALDDTIHDLEDRIKGH
jgi:hypothetical protein